MKNSIYVLSLFLIVSCSSDDEPLKDYSIENEQEIIEYIAQHNLNATRTDSGLYYVIDEIGTGNQPTATSDISVKFKGSFTDGTIFEDTEGEIISFNLQGLISGWIEGIQYFKEGGSGMLLIPAHLGFGSRDNGNIPAGSVLIFEIELIDYAIENEQEIQDYLIDNQITTAIRSDSGLHYVIDEEGTGSQPTENSNVTVVYNGYFTDGETFDESNTDGVSFNLSQVIPGWKEGIQYFKEGGNGTLLVPSHLAYGIYDYNQIPGGSVLIFDIELKSIN